MRFQQTHNQGLRHLLLMVSWDFRAKRATPDGVRPCISVVPEATHETETRELLGGTEENSVSPMRGH